jgi:hypothetical protein
MAFQVGVFTAPAGPSPQTATFTWTPTGGDVGLNSLVVQLQDNGCPVLGSQTRAIDITVLQGTTAGPDQVYCTGGGSSTTECNWRDDFYLEYSIRNTWKPQLHQLRQPECNTLWSRRLTKSSATFPDLAKNRDTVIVSTAPTFTLAMGPSYHDLYGRCYKSFCSAFASRCLYLSLVTRHGAFVHDGWQSICQSNDEYDL